MTEQLTGHARTLLQEAARVLVLTGAGVSAESGVPTFRGAGGVWKSLRVEDLATPEAFHRDPRLVWEWYGMRRFEMARCRPNAAHRALATWMRGRAGVTLVTQNVDGLHELAAGEDHPPGESPVVRLHGSIYGVRCTGCSHRAEDRTPVDATSEATLPRCPACAGLLRPDVVWFGELLPLREMRRAEAAAAKAQVCLVIGTQGAVYPAAGLVHIAGRSGRARIIVVDPGETAFDAMADVRLRGRAAEVVPRILEA